MIEYEQFIFLDVYRTGSSHLVDLFGRICTAPPVREFRHASLTKGRPWGTAGGKPVLATVRNPWDWYVSLWGIIADGKKPIGKPMFEHLSEAEFRHLYDRDDPKAAFGRWLRMMHDPEQLNRSLGREHLPQSGLAPVIGLYTYRFLRVTTRWPRMFLRRPFIGGTEGAVRYHRLMKAYDTLLRNETLTEDLARFVERHPRGFRPDAVQMIRAADARPKNASKRPLSSYREYYGAEEAALVEARDRFFVRAFGYTF